MIFFLKIHILSLITREHQMNPIEQHSSKYLTTTLQKVKVIKDKKRFRNCH